MIYYVSLVSSNCEGYVRVIIVTMLYEAFRKYIFSRNYNIYINSPRRFYTIQIQYDFCPVC